MGGWEPFVTGADGLNTSAGRSLPLESSDRQARQQHRDGGRASLGPAQSHTNTHKMYKISAGGFTSIATGSAGRYSIATCRMFTSRCLPHLVSPGESEPFDGGLVLLCVLGLLFPTPPQERKGTVHPHAQHTRNLGAHHPLTQRAPATGTGPPPSMGRRYLIAAQLGCVGPSAHLACWVMVLFIMTEVRPWGMQDGR